MTGLKAAVLFSLVSVSLGCGSNWINFLNNLNNQRTTTTTAKPTTLPPSTDCECGVANRVSRIVGGVATEENEYPWQIGLASGFGRTPYCGGSIISSKTILTAAHCTRGKNPSSIYVVVGEHDLTQSDGEKYVRVCAKNEHPSYSSSTVDYDFATLTLCEDLTWAKDIAPVCLPSDAGQGTKYEGVASVVSGWGTLSTNGARPALLQEVTVNSLTNAACCASPYTAYRCSYITDRMICAASSGKDSCQGDSGGPMVTMDGAGYSLTGIVSWGFGCAQANAPGVYARVTNQLDWINDKKTGTTCQAPTA